MHNIVELNEEQKKLLKEEAFANEVKLEVKSGTWPQERGEFDFKTNTVKIPKCVNLDALKEYFKKYNWCNKEIIKEECFKIILFHEIGHKVYSGMKPLGSTAFPEEKQDKFAYDKVFNAE